jgi:hypothetical protein
VEALTRIALARLWGGGEVASADGLRFVVSVPTLNAGFNAKYFGRQRGVTLFNFTADLQMGFYHLVVPGTIMDHVLTALQAEGVDVRPEDAARLSLLGHRHLNLLGRYHFTLPEALARGERRPLRDPNMADDEDLDAEPGI